MLDIGTYIYIYIPGNSEDTFSPIAWSTVWAIYREYVYINIRVYIYIHIYIFSRPKTRSIPNISTSYILGGSSSGFNFSGYITNIN